MKRTVIFIFFLLCPLSALAAHAIIYSIQNITESINPPAPNSVLWLVNISYQGDDVPNLQETVTGLQVAVSTSATASQIASDFVAATTNYAASQGFTVPTGGTFVPTYTAQ